MFTISFVVRGLDWLRLESERIIERFSNDCRKTKAKAITVLRPITTGANSAMNQSQFLAIETCSKRGKNHAYMARLVLVLLLIG